MVMLAATVSASVLTGWVHWLCVEGSNACLMPFGGQLAQRALVPVLQAVRPALSA